MSWEQVLALAALVLGGGGVAALYLARAQRRKLAAETETSYARLAAEERARAEKAEREVDGLRDALQDSELTTSRAKEDTERLRLELATVRLENDRLRRGVPLQHVIARLLLAPGGDIAAVFNASRDLWLVTTPEDGGTVVMALGGWNRIGISQEDLLGTKWRRLVTEDSASRTERAEASALSAGGRVANWYVGRDRRRRPGLYHVVWTFGRYNGETLSLGRVNAYRPVLAEPSPAP